jgi:hypothetical protein
MRARAERRRSELNRHLEHDLPHQCSRRAHEHEAGQPGRLDGHFDAGPDRDRALADDGPEIVGPDRVPGVDAHLHRPRNHQFAAGLERPVAVDALDPHGHLADEGIGEGDRADGRGPRGAQGDLQRDVDLLERDATEPGLDDARLDRHLVRGAPGMQGGAGRGDRRHQHGNQAGSAGEGGLDHDRSHHAWELRCGDRERRQ